jgi:hypothetical protein
MNTDQPPTQTADAALPAKGVMHHGPCRARWAGAEIMSVFVADAQTTSLA